VRVKAIRGVVISRKVDWKRERCTIRTYWDRFQVEFRQREVRKILINTVMRT
jgi:hypothetical protein